MSRLLPFALLIGLLSLFGLSWIVIEIDPTSAHWYIFALFIFLVFASTFCFLALALYFLRTRIYKHYSSNWYFKTSFKMAFYIAFFIAIVATLTILKLVTAFNVILTILAVSLFALWSYLGKKN